MSNKRHQSQKQRGRGANGPTRRGDYMTPRQVRAYVTSYALRVPEIQSAASNLDKDKAIEAVQALLPTHFPGVESLPRTEDGVSSDLVIAQGIVALFNSPRPR